MKIFKKLLCAIILAVVTFTFVGCGDGDKTPTLATPQNVQVTDEGLISWDAVENADYYVVVLNEVNLKANGTSYQVGSVINDFTYQIIAVAESGFNPSAPSELKTFEGKGVPVIVDPIIENLTVSVSGKQLVGSGRETTLTGTVSFTNGTSNNLVTWSIVEGGDYGSIDASGKFTAKEVTEDHDVTVRATSVQNDKKYADYVITVACQPSLTAEMLAGIQDDYIGFEGYMDIDLYNFGIYESFERTVTISGISTSMDGEKWHASYVDASSGYTSEINYRKVDGVAQEVVLSLMNDEEYYPMTDDRGDKISWEDAGLYNNFKGLAVEDFTFSEEDWRYYYSGTDAQFMQKVIASSNPYDFSVNRFGLIIEEGELLGIYAESNPDYAVVQGYKAIEKFYSYINCGQENVTVPEIVKYAHNPMTDAGTPIDHDSLQTAIDNMRSLTSYKLDFTISSHMAGGAAINGYYETVVDGDYYFEPYNVTVVNNRQVKTLIPDSQYGYHKLSDTLYNSYNYDKETDSYVAARAFNGNMDDAKASFAFAPEIFTSYALATVDGKEAKVYYVNDNMCNVASTMYYGVGNDQPLYGLYAMKYDMLADYTTYVVIQDGKILEVGWFYFLGEMYGEVRIHYTDLNTAELPESFLGFENYTPRVAPSSWNDLTVIDQTLDGNDEEVNAYTFFTKLLGSEENADLLPFFGEDALLGDTFGFGLATYFNPDGGSRQVPTVILYYDVPLEADRTINGTIKATQEYLVQHGFVKNANGAYVKGDVSVMPYDSSLDFWIYVWKTVK